MDLNIDNESLIDNRIHNKSIKRLNGFLYKSIKIGNGFYRIHYSSLNVIMDPFWIYKIIALRYKNIDQIANNP